MGLAHQRHVEVYGALIVPPKHRRSAAVFVNRPPICEGGLKMRVGQFSMREDRLKTREGQFDA